LLSKSGEAETAKRRLDAITRENDRRFASLQQDHNSTVARHKVEVEKLRQERERDQTNNEFEKHDLAREAERAKRARKPLREAVPSKSKATSVPSPAGTPRRAQKTLPLRDGFDDDDVMMASPTKNRSKAATPKQVNKRKRQITDQSPIPALQLSEPRERPQAQESFASTSAEKLDSALFSGLQRNDRRFELLHRLVNNRSSNGKDRVLEAMTLYAFPSQPEKKLSSLLYDELSACSLEHNVHCLAIKICHIFLSLWDQCLQEKYYAPVYLFLDALQFILASEPSSTAVAITDQAVPIIYETVYLVTLPIARAINNASATLDLYSPTQKKINGEIDASDCLRLLHLIATSCVMSVEASSRFWQTIPFDFFLALLKKEQPLAWIQLALSILSTSSLPDSLGSIVPAHLGPEQQQKRQSNLIDQVTFLMFETPQEIPEPALSCKLPQTEVLVKPPSSTPTSSQYSTQQILSLRLQIIGVLTTFSLTSHGCKALARNRLCLGRLIDFLNSQLSLLYTPTYTAHPDRALVVACINSTMKLVNHIKTSNPDVNLAAKMNNVHGGSHKYLVALTRLAFSEGGDRVLEEGIEDDVSDAAHEILGEGLSFEEGEGLMQVFSSGNSV
jgi:hypothetical protein